MSAKNKRETIAAQLALRVALRVLPPVVALVWGLGILGRQELRNQISATNRATVELVAVAIERYLSGVQQTIAEAADRPMVVRGVRAQDWAQVTTVLESMHRHMDRFSYFFVQDSAGMIRARFPPPDTIGQDAAFQDDFQKVMSTGRSVISGVYRSTASGELTVAVAAPVVTNGAGPEAVLMGALSLEAFREFATTLSQTAGVEVEIFDHNARVVALGDRPHPHVHDSVADELLARRGLAGGYESGEIERSGERLLGTFAPVSRFGWGVLIVQSLSSIYAPLWRVGWFLTGSLVFVLIGGGLIVWRMTHRFLRPLSLLDEATQRLAAGELDVRTNVYRDDEIGSLAHSFNLMAESVRDARQKYENERQALRRANIDLAAEVEERERAEARLRESEEQHRMLAENARELIVVHDLSGRIEYANPASEQTLGYPLSQIVGSSVTSLLSEESARTVAERATRRRDGDPSQFSYELEVRHADGHFIPLEVNSAVLRRSTGDVAVMLVARDVSQRRQIESQVVAAERTEAVGRLAGGVAHDLNNQLFVIQGYGEMILDRLPEDPVSRAALQEIRAAAARAADTVRRLLAVGRRQVLKPKVIDLNAEIRQAEPVLRSLLGEQLRLKIELAPGLGDVRVDPGQLRQVLSSLALNSRAAMSTGGTLTISTADLPSEQANPLVGSAFARGGSVRIVVADDGCGMSPEILEHAFEPFFTTSEAGVGTGLGLATVHGIVTQSGGVITIDSALGEGTRIAIDLPRAVPDAVPGAVSDVAQASGSRRATVLVVEDEAPLRALIVDVLRGAGYGTLSAVDGVQALRVAEASIDPIDLLLTDVVMPHMDGPALAKHLVRLRPGIKIIFMSGYSEDAVRQHGTFSTAALLIQKPCSVSALLEKVREVLAD